MFSHWPNGILEKKDLNITCKENLKSLVSFNKLNKELLETNVKLASVKNEITIDSSVIESCGDIRSPLVHSIAYQHQM